MGECRGEAQSMEGWAGGGGGAVRWHLQRLGGRNNPGNVTHGGTGDEQNAPFPRESATAGTARYPIACVWGRGGANWASTVASREPVLQRCYSQLLQQ